jgi:peptidoglycan/xylan/chitin deacetylase (PgdA/CDA1 family)
MRLEMRSCGIASRNFSRGGLANSRGLSQEAVPAFDHILARWSRDKDTLNKSLLALCYHGVTLRRRDDRLERNFHRIADFRGHSRFLKRRRAVTLQGLNEILTRQAAADCSGAAITFDDGYANNLLAAEILLEAKLPFAIFVTTGAVGADKAIWTVELSLLLLHGRCDALEALGQRWQLKTREEREAVFQTIRYRLKAMPAPLRREAMDGIRAQFPASETQRLLEQFPAFQMLTWKEIRQLAETGVEIGSHGVDHEIHHAVQDPEVRRRELVESKQEIERQVGRPCRFFAFPNGDSCERSAREVEEAGYEMAFTTQPGLTRFDSNRFLLPRVSPGGSVAKLKQQLRELR